MVVYGILFGGMHPENPQVVATIAFFLNILQITKLIK